MRFATTRSQNKSVSIEVLLQQPSSVIIADNLTEKILLMELATRRNDKSIVCRLGLEFLNVVVSYNVPSDHPFSTTSDYFKVHTDCVVYSVENDLETF